MIKEDGVIIKTGVEKSNGRDIVYSTTTTTKPFNPKQVGVG
jgi:hypothetical protein